ISVIHKKSETATGQTAKKYDFFREAEGQTRQNHEERNQRRYAGCQAIQSVSQIDRIAHSHHDKNDERNVKPPEIQIYIGDRNPYLRSSSHKATRTERSVYGEGS